MTEDEAQAAVNAARQAHDKIEALVRGEKEAAGRAIDARYAPEKQAAREKLAAATRALTAAQDAGAAHPWDGQRVYRMKGVGRFWERRPPVRINGIVETVRSTTHLPANTAGYRRPSIGQGIVRLLKKDGTPGLAFETLNTHQGWKLDEGSAEGVAAQVEGDSPREAS